MASLNFVPSGGLSSFYTGNMAPPDRGPNGTLVQSQSRGQPTSLSEIYGGIIPSQAPMSTGLTSRSVNTVPVDMYGNPIRNASSQSGIQAPSSGAQRTVGQAGSVAMPPGVTPASVQQAFAQMAQQPSQAQRNALAAVPMSGKDQSRLAPTDTGGPKQMPMLDTSGMIARNLDPYTNAYGSPLSSTGNAALNAIGQQTNSAPIPRANPFGYGASTPIPAVSQPYSSSATTYTVRPGDTLSGIAKTFYGSAKAAPNLAAANGISNPNKIRAGQTITLGAGTPTQGPAIKTKSGGYVIKSGDTLSAIAKKNGTTVAALAAKNGIKDPNKIVAGAKIKV